MITNIPQPRGGTTATPFCLRLNIYICNLRYGDVQENLKINIILKNILKYLKIVEIALMNLTI